MSLTREELTAALQRRNPSMTQQRARMIVDLVIDEMASALLEDETLKIRGFGVFRVREKGPRPGRNLQNGEPCEVPALRSLTFRPSGKLVKAINEGRKKLEV